MKDISDSDLFPLGTLLLIPWAKQVLLFRVFTSWLVLNGYYETWKLSLVYFIFIGNQWNIVWMSNTTILKLINSINLFILSFILPSIHSFIKSIIYSCIDSCIHSTIILFIHSTICSFIHSYIHSFILQRFSSISYLFYTHTAYSLALLLTHSIRDSETSIDFVQGPPGSRRERVNLWHKCFQAQAQNILLHLI